MISSSQRWTRKTGTIRERGSGTHHGALFDAVARLDDAVLLSRPAQEVGQLAVGALQGLALGSVCTVAAFVLGDKRGGNTAQPG